MAEVLSRFLQRAAAEPFTLGEWDCSMFLANWMCEVSGRDPASHLRGQYSTARGWKRIVRTAGGLMPLVDGIVSAAGMVRVDDPRTGDVGVVDLPGVGLVGAIKVDRGWAMKIETGLVVGPVTEQAAWGWR